MGHFAYKKRTVKPFFFNYLISGKLAAATD